jgi:hypothetical protein
VPATAIAWGPWVPEDGGGLAAAPQARTAAERAGLRVLTDQDAWPLLDAALAGDGPPTLVAVSADLAGYARRLGAHPAAHLVAGTTGDAPPDPVQAPWQEKGSRDKGWLRAVLDGADDRLPQLAEAVREVVGDILGTTESIDDHAGFNELGMDSIMVIDLRERLVHALGIDLSATIGLDHPTVESMAHHLDGLLHPPEPTAPVPAASTRRAPEDTAGDLSALSAGELIAAARAELMTEE